MIKKSLSQNDLKGYVSVIQDTIFIYDFFHLLRNLIYLLTQSDEYSKLSTKITVENLARLNWNVIVKEKHHFQGETSLDIEKSKVYWNWLLKK